MHEGDGHGPTDAVLEHGRGDALGPLPIGNILLDRDSDREAGVGCAAGR